MSDEDLIFLINSGSKLAETVFYKRYSRYSNKIAKEYYEYFKSSGISREDFYAVALAKTHAALMNYTNVSQPFNRYWKSAVRNAVYDYVRHNSYKCSAKALSGISFDEECYPNNEHMLFHDIYGEDESSREIYELIEKYVYGPSDYLSDDQKLLADLLFFKEWKPSSILEYTHWTRARLSYLIRATKKKIQRLLKENYL